MFSWKIFSEFTEPLEFSIKDSFDATSGIKDISQDLLHNGYQFISFDEESLFTNVPIKRTADTASWEAFVKFWRGYRGSIKFCRGLKKRRGLKFWREILR